MVVVDASVLVDAFAVDGAVGDASRRELAADPEWAAPEHMLVEALSAVRGRARGRLLSPQRSVEVLSRMREVVIVSVPTRHLMPRMWELRENLTAYDAAYVAAAELLECPLLTSDAPIGRASGVRCEVRVPAP